MTDWTFHNLSCRGPMIPVKSVAHAIALFMEASGESEYAVCLEFFGTPLGAIDSVVGREFATLTFDPHCNHRVHSVSAARSACPARFSAKDEMYFVDDTDTLSAISPAFLLPILDVVRALEYILVKHDFPEFLEWRSGG